MLAREARNALASVPVDSIDACGSIPARVGVALVDVDLTVASRRARLTAALVAAYQILTMTSKLARVRLALIDLSLADPAGVPWVTVAGEAVVSVDALAAVTRR